MKKFGRGNGFRGNLRRGEQWPKRGSPGPLGTPRVNGTVTRCYTCDSTFHYPRNCPHKEEESTLLTDQSEVSDQKPLTEADVNSIHITLYNDAEPVDHYEIFVAEATNPAVIDTACSKTVCGRDWLENFIREYDETAKDLLRIKSSKLPFRFGDSSLVYSYQNIILPVRIGNLQFNISTEVVDKNIPLLLSKASMKRADASIDLQKDRVCMFGQVIDTFETSSGHYAIPLKPASGNELVEAVLLTTFEKL